MSAPTFSSDLEELDAWIVGVSQLPKFLRTREARGLLEALIEKGFASKTRAAEHSIDCIAEAIGQTKDVLLSSIRKCPFGVSFGG